MAVGWTPEGLHKWLICTKSCKSLLVNSAWNQVIMTWLQPKCYHDRLKGTNISGTLQKCEAAAHGLMNESLCKILPPKKNKNPNEVKLLKRDCTRRWCLRLWNFPEVTVDSTQNLLNVCKSFHPTNEHLFHNSYFQDTMVCFTGPLRHWL